MRAIDELLDRLNFETESVASEVPWKGEVLQVHLQVSRQPTKKEEVRFLFRGSGGMVFGFARASLGRDVDVYFTLGGRILDLTREVSGVGLVGLHEVVFNGRLRGGAVRGTGKAVDVPNIGEWQCTICGAAHFWNTRLSCYRCGTIGIGSLAVQVLGVLLVVKVVGMGSRWEWLVRVLVGVEALLGRVEWGLPWEGYVGSAQLVVIRRMFLKVSPPSGRVVVPRVGGGMWVFLVLVLVGFGLRKGCRVVVLGRLVRWVEEPLPPNLSQRDQALGVLNALIQVLGPEIGPQVKGLVEGLLHQKPASPVPTTPTHAEVVARLYELYDSEKKVTKKVEEAKGRLETARPKVMEAEEGMAEVDGRIARNTGPNESPFEGR